MDFDGEAWMDDLIRKMEKERRDRERCMKNYSDWLWGRIFGVGMYKRLDGVTKSNGLFDYEKFVPKALEDIGNNLLTKNGRYTIRKKIAKNAAQANKFREEGNKYFTSSHCEGYERALRSYTKSIAYAVLGSKELALAYANRSAVLLKLDCPQESLEDTERALELDYPEKLKPKLFFRQGECYAELAEECYILSKFWLSSFSLEDYVEFKSLREKLQDYPLKDKEEFVDHGSILPEIPTRSEKFYCASDAVDVQYSEKFGRHLVATRDVEIGEVLVIEEPYFRYLEVDKLHVNCSYCMNFMWNGIPCDECVNEVYCSEACKRAAWTEYHNYDCAVYDLSLQYEVPLSGGQCSKIFLQMVHEAGGIEQLKQRVDAFKKTTNGQKFYLKDEWYKKSTLEGILILNTQEDDIDYETSRKITLTVMRSLLFLAFNTDFFGTQFDREKNYDAYLVKEMAKDPNIIFAGQLMVRLAMIVRINSTTTSEEIAKEPEKSFTTTPGSFTLPLLGLLNHSCIPNSLKQYKKYHAVLHAVLPIKKGEQIFCCYNYMMWNLGPKEVRNKFCEEQLCFSCSCIACQNNWQHDKKKLISFAAIQGEQWKKIHQDEITDTYAELDKTSQKIDNKDVSDKDEMLSELYKIVKFMWEKVNLPCMEFDWVMDLIDRVHSMTGISSKMRSQSAYRN